MFPKKGFNINFGGRPGGGSSRKDSGIPKKEVDYTGEESYENDRNEEVAQVIDEFKESARKENERRDDYMDNEHYSCVVFSNKAQRQAFFKQLGVDVSDETDIRFINGVMLAKILGIELPPLSVMPPEKFKVSKAVMQLTHLPKPRQKTKTP